MSFKNKYINITDWTGRKLLNAEYDSKEVDSILDINRCHCIANGVVCDICGDTGYKGDFEVTWEDTSDKDGCNVYEYINY